MFGRLLLGITAVLAAAPAPTCAQGRSPFDGTWLVLLHCDAARDGAEGYTLHFLASVQNAVLHGENGVRGEPSSMALDGTIQPDGSALLSAQGLTGNPVYSVGRVRSALPYSYHMRARFDAGHGTATRLELRPCDAVFTKQ